jgi:coenzyme F420 hydrogenase subunit beta
MSASELFEKVVGVGLCTACGTCVGICPEGCLYFDAAAEIPVLRGDCVNCGLCLNVCPGKDIPLPQLEKVTFGRERDQGEQYLGVYRSLKVGQACDEKIRSRGTSGGIASALLCHALDSGIIDSALITQPDPMEPWIGKPRLVSSAGEILQAARSRYVLVPLNSILQQIVERNLNRVALVGLPCHIHGLRKMKLEPALRELGKRISLVVGIFCGTNYSRRVMEHFIQEFFGVPLESIRSFHYRGGTNNQEVILTTKDGREMKTTQQNRIFLMTGHKKERCLVCADLYNDLADISVGDAFTFGDHKAVPNVSLIIVRNKNGEEILLSAEKSNAVRTSPIGIDVFYGNIGFERKLHGTPYRLEERKKFGWPVPDFGRRLPSEPVHTKPYRIDLEGLEHKPK